MKTSIDSNALLEAVGYYFVFGKDFSITELGGNLEKVIPEIVEEEKAPQVPVSN